MLDEKASSAAESVPGRPDFAAFALPTAGVSLIFAAFLMLWPEWSMRMIAGQAMQGRLIWIVPGLALFINAAANGVSLRSRVWSFAGIVEVVWLAICAMLVALGCQLLPAERSSLRSALFWEHLAPNGFHRVAVDLLAYSYFGLVAGVFVAPLAIAVLREIAENVFAVEPPVENRPA